MEAGLFYTPVGPWLAAAAFLALVFVAFRNPLGGTLSYVALVYASHYLTYRSELQAIVAGAGALVLLSAAAIRRPPALRGLFARLTLADGAMLLFFVLMLIAAIRGVLAGHSRTHLFADGYHYLVLIPGLYVVGRRLLHPDDVSSCLRGLAWISAIFAIPALLIMGLAADTELLWYVGSPLDDGGARLKPDFAYPMVPLVIAASLHLSLGGARLVAPVALLTGVLALTYKRTYWGATAFGTLVAAAAPLVGTVRGPLDHLRRTLRRTPLLVVALALGLALAVLAGLDVRHAGTRGADLTHPGSVETVGTRASELEEVLRHVRAAPLGYGLGAAPEIPFAGGTPTHYTHTIYLQWCLQGGIPAAIAGTGLLGALLAGLFRRRSERAARALLGALAALALAGFALQSLNSPISALVMGLAAGLLSRPATARPARPVAPR